MTDSDLCKALANGIAEIEARDAWRVRVELFLDVCDHVAYNIASGESRTATAQELANMFEISGIQK